MTKAKVFMNGRSQAIRLPKDFRVNGSEVYLRKTARGFIVTERDPWDVFKEGAKKLSPEFMDLMEKRKRSPAEQRDWNGIFE